MRIGFYAFPAAILALTLQTALAKDIGLNDLPEAARRTAQTELKSGTLKKVESVDKNGHNIYALTFQRPDGSSKYIYLNPDGTYVRDQGAAPTTSTVTGGASAQGQELQLNQLPEAVRRTIQTETKNGPVSRVVQLPHTASTMYEVFFRQPSGQEKVIYLNPDGSYVKNNSQPAAGGTRSWDALSSTRNTSQRLSSPIVVNFSQLPTPVQTTVRNQAGAARIQNIQVGELNGQQVYQAQFTRNGQPVQIQVNSSGTLLSTSQAQSSFGSSQP